MYSKLNLGADHDVSDETWIQLVTHFTFPAKSGKVSSVTGRPATGIITAVAVFPVSTFVLQSTT